MLLSKIGSPRVCQMHPKGGASLKTARLPRRCASTWLIQVAWPKLARCSMHMGSIVASEGFVLRERGVSSSALSPPAFGFRLMKRPKLRCTCNLIKCSQHWTDVQMLIVRTCTLLLQALGFGSAPRAEVGSIAWTHFGSPSCLCHSSCCNCCWHLVSKRGCWRATSASPSF